MSHGAVEFCCARDDIKSSIVDSMLAYPSNVTCAITSPNIVDFFRRDVALSEAWRFGLVCSETMFDSRFNDGLSIPQSDPSLVFFFESDRHAAIDVNHPVNAYAGSFVFNKGVCRLVFVTRQAEPIPDRFTGSDFTPHGSSGRSMESFFADYGPGREKLLREFRVRVFKICDGGSFVVSYDVSKRMAENRALMPTSSIDKRKWSRAFYIDDIALNAREISEIVYWLWHRDGKVSKYPELCKRHPELFEPISGLDDFKTEIGRMLVERSKQ